MSAFDEWRLSAAPAPTGSGSTADSSTVHDGAGLGAEGGEGGKGRGEPRPLPLLERGRVVDLTSLMYPAPGTLLLLADLAPR